VVPSGFVVSVMQTHSNETACNKKQCAQNEKYEISCELSELKKLLYKAKSCRPEKISIQLNCKKWALAVAASNSCHAV
jgi:hypothetical protein